jgi:hypothetical protein
MSMPTPAGKPRVGETIVNRDGTPIFKVLHRYPGEGYSVKVLRLTNDEYGRGKGQEKIITEFEWWVTMQGWTVRT